MRPHLKESVRLLQNEAAANQKKRQPYTPLTQQIRNLTGTLPPAILQRAWLMSEFVSKLSGKYRDNPHPQHVATALRETGWKSKRIWRDGYAGRRVWIYSVGSQS